MFREALAKAGLVKALFDRFHHDLDAKGYFARGGQSVDATIVSAPKQRVRGRRTRRSRRARRRRTGKTKPAKNAHEDKHARWSKKNERNVYGYKNHIRSTASTS
jgi:IS5 family transposase